MNGEIAINGTPIAFWSARRLNDRNPEPAPDDVFEYEWTYTDIQLRRTYTGKVKHCYGEGAAILLTKVMLELAKTTHGD